ncbi:MAG TPA: CRISPR-associated protein Cas4 [Cyclobacteriaceae bacterium]
MTITATHIAYLHVCHRKLWLFSNGINMESTSDLVSEGKLIGETTYTDRSRKFTQVELDGIKIDFYDARNKVVHEVKKSSSIERAHIAQVQYYLYKLQQRGIDNATGIIEYPRLKQREPVAALSLSDAEAISQWEEEAKAIASFPKCPPVIRAKICKTCSYHDFCYATESL